MTLRSRILFGFGAMPWIISAMAMIAFGANNGPLEVLVPALFFLGICYLVAMFSMFSLVRLTAEELVIRNPGKQIHIPWSKVRGASGDDGLEITIAGRTEKTYSATYQKSLIGALAGYPGAKKAAGRICKFRDAVSMGRSTKHCITEAVPWRAHVLWMGSGLLLLAVVMPAIGRHSS